MSIITRKLEIDISSNDRDDVQLQRPGLDATPKHSNAAAHAHMNMSESNERNLDAGQMMHETMDKVMTDNGILVDGAGYLTMGHSGTWPQRDEGEMHHRFAPDIRANNGAVHHLSAARAADTYCRPNESIHRQPTVANLNTAFEGYVTSSRSMHEPGSETILKPVVGGIAQLNDEVQRLSQLDFFASIQTDAVANDEASQNEALARARAKPPHLPGQSNLKSNDSLPVTTTSASRNPAIYGGHATRTRQDHIGQRPTSVPAASTPAVDSDDFMLFLNRMIDMVDDDSNEVHSTAEANDDRTEKRHEDAST